MFKNMELRKLPAGTLCEIINTLETNNDWKTVMALIPKNPSNNNTFEPKYNDDDLRLVENHSKATNRQCAEIFIDEWATSGQVRPTLTTLKEITLQANILKAADQIAALLKEGRAPRPSDGPGADIDTDVSNILRNEDIKQRFNSFEPTKRIQRDFSNYKNVCNASTAAIKSENRTENFSFNIPNIKLLNASSVTSNSKQLSLTSRNIPDLDMLLQKSQNNDRNSTRINSEIESSQDSIVQFQKQCESENNSYQKSLPNISDLKCCIDKEILEDTKLFNFEYSDLETITNNFSETIVDGPFGPSGKIGSGGFGEVFVGFHPTFQMPLAVKKIYKHSLWYSQNPQIVIDMFNTEVKNLTQLRHKNILPILGFSLNGPVPCMISEYIEGGSLQQQIEAKVLNERQRIRIMLGTADGLRYLHSSEVIVKDKNGSENVIKKNSFVHRDVKSANILITKDCIPKIGDFGLVKQQQSTCITDMPKGTHAYMAPEGFSGTISPKIDVYSYGIVLLELLTGLKPIIGSNITINIKDYVHDHTTEYGDIKGILDPVVEEWGTAEEIYALSQKCLEYDRNRRPSIENVCEVLNTISN